MGSRENVILIVLDTLRDDYSGEIDYVLKKYGFSKLPNVISTYPWTLPSHASMFTGFYAKTHSAHETKNKKVPEIKLKGYRLLTHSLKERGYTNYLFTANDYIRPFYGFGGFDHKKIVPAVPVVIDSDSERERIKKYKGENNLETFKNLVAAREFSLLYKYTMREISLRMRPVLKLYHHLAHNWPLNKGVGKLIKYLKNNKFQEPFFLYVNLMEVHEPYYLSDKAGIKYVINSHLDDKIIEMWKKRYPLHVKYLSKKLNRVMEILKSRGILDRSLVIITSDHGQRLGEGGVIGHGVYLTDELVRVPMWINKSVKDISGYLSLRKIRNIVVDFATEGKLEINKYYKSYVYSECYGIQNKYKVTDRNREIVDRLDSYRVAVYCCDGKAIFNVKKWEMEKVEGMDEGRAKELVMRFLDTGS